MAETKGLRFLEALEFAKVGNKIRRAGWDAGAFVFYVPKEVAVWKDDSEKTVQHRGCMCWCEVQDAPSVAELAPFDILASDWEVVA